MKSFVTLLELFLWLAITKPQPAPAQVGPAIFCLAIAAAAVGGVCYVYSCNVEKYYCVQDLNDQGNAEGPFYILGMRCRGDASKHGVKVWSGPYKDERVAYQNCETNNFPAFLIPSFDLYEPTLHFEFSEDLIHWRPLLTVDADPECFDFELPKLTQNGFVRAWY